MKKLMSSLGALAVCFMLTGCCLSHEWQEATCTEPKTCSKCGEVEGEALGHTWVEATCAEPKKCSVCGETDGETLEHTWIEATCAEPKKCSVCGETEGEALAHTLLEANYQQAATCQVCGETVGEPLQSDFEKYALDEYLVELDKEYDYVTMCHEDNSYSTVGKATFSNYRTYTSDDMHPQKEGYEWKSVDLSIVFGDENALEYGMEVGMYMDDYYNDAKFYDEGIINYLGVDYTDVVVTADHTDEYSGWENDKNTYTVTLSACVPIGYDGLLIVLANDQVDWTYIYDLKGTDPLFFRFE